MWFVFALSALGIGMFGLIFILAVNGVMNHIDRQNRKLQKEELEDFEK